MKTNQIHKISAAAFIMVVLTIASANSVFAQRRTREYQPEKRENSKGKYENHDHQSNKRRDNRNWKNDDRVKRNQQNRNHDRDYTYRAPHNERHDYDRNWNKNKRWDNDRRWHNERQVYVYHKHYRIPRYNGRVRVYARAPWGFQQHPVIIRHRFGDIYYFGGNFYTYMDRYGYVQIEAPRNVMFTTIPRGAVRVRVNGHLMFRLGDLYFSLGTGGYHIVTPDAYPEVYGYIDRY